MILIFGKSRYKLELASLEHVQKAEHYLTKMGQPPANFSAEQYLKRAERIGYLRQVLGCIPEPGTFLRIDYEGDLKHHRSF